MVNKVKKIEKIFRAKDLRRRQLAKLPFEKKIEILVKLQEMAKGIKREENVDKKMIWRIREVKGSEGNRLTEKSK
jgi:hypothetical protein